mmetsp:Transcript_37924/g.33948  ORF Transcript_37924/g.33948 Transcript_37924/m.33948 type:complete len:170 (-) Transcript_37924:354-863(-)
MAPEILLGESSNQKTLDWWSMGVILYEMLVGIPPFNAQTLPEVQSNITSKNIEWPPIERDQEGSISPEAFDLIDRLLTLNPRNRLGFNGAEEIKNHPFFKGVKWDQLREQEAPIMPVLNSPILKNLPPMEGFDIDVFKYDSIDKVIDSKNTKADLDFGAFWMRRLDVLD